MALSVDVKIRAHPRAGKTEVAGVHGDRVKIRIAAPPVDGAANDELVSFLAKRLGVPRSRVEILSGETSRDKRVRIHGVGASEARKKLGL